MGANRIVLTAGSWARGLLAEQGIDLPLKIMPCQLGFYQPKNSADFEPGKFPVFFAHMNGDYGEMPYGIPHEDPSIGVKNHHLLWVGYRRQAQRSRLHPPARSGPSGFGALLNSTFPMRRVPYWLPAAASTPSPPKKHFIVDQHPHHPQVVIGAGFSGHGFKFTTLMGKMLADLAVEGSTPHDTSLFKVTRFLPVAV